MTAFFLKGNADSPIASGDGGFFRSSYDPGERCSLVVQHQEVDIFELLEKVEKMDRPHPSFAILFFSGAK